MSEWQEKLKSAGLGCGTIGADVSMIRENDPSRNRMVRFVKPVPQLQSMKKLGKGNANDMEEEPTVAPIQTHTTEGLSLFVQPPPQTPSGNTTTQQTLIN